ncbi:unnamed protein product (macronuclear) [Paramecium tetraurelia]|uniref:Protein BCP1 n=1 Tax=Paramecium tetraurelia TaxID=5888 RepID=A0D9H5_PARTE|nr:uncharacterized protein GSPATT00014622001 [Paramecium tetraurelia]CAK79692.1 unnamed protein product [Paramecium tetraurelia]|eukprot:XP_001447089.1 hypothetical protein (macronuclear) [Paramecium tetraurelia strain d4-2]
MNQGNQDKRKQRDYEDEDSEEEEVEQPINVHNKGDMEEEVNLDFVFLDPNQKQFHSIKTFINGYLEGISFKSSELANIICDQVELGTMVGQEDEDNVFGFTTILNIGEIKSNAIGEILHYVDTKSQQYNKQHQQLQHIFQTPKKIGLFINERILNLAPQLVPILHNQLKEDINWLQKEDPSNSLTNLDYLLVITKCFKDNDQQKQTQKKSTSDLNDLIFQKFEDFVFLQKSVVSFRFLSEGSKQTQQVSDYMKTEQEGQICYRLIYLIQLKDYLAQIANIEQYVQQ